MKRRGTVTTSKDRVSSVRRVARRAGSLALLFLLAFGQRVADSKYSILETSSLYAIATARCLPLGSLAVLGDVTQFITLKAANSLAAACRVPSYSIRDKVSISRKWIIRLSYLTAVVCALSESLTQKRAFSVIT